VNQPIRRIQIGADVGGTFTDVVAHDLERGTLSVGKVFSTPDDPIVGIVRATERALAEVDCTAADVVTVRHGTTIATNALLERRGAKTALITTQGFADVLTVGRQTRPSLYDLRARRPTPVIPQWLTYECDERTAWNGEIVRGIELDKIEAVIERLSVPGLEAVAICFLHSYSNSKNERLAYERLVEMRPDLVISLSSDVCPQLGEYERATTTAVNAYVTPAITRYLRGLEEEFAGIAFPKKVYTMQSNGGAMTSSAAASRSVHTLLSGPAGGLMGARYFAGLTGISEAISLDVGGTSADVGLIVNGVVQQAPKGEIGGFPIRIPFLNIETVGAGGGSIAWVDSAGALRVGPQSAGAEPGPMCYGRGGVEPTVTDAQVVLGRIGPATRLAGLEALDRGAAFEGIARLAKGLGEAPSIVAGAIIEIANAAMTRAIRILTVERGLQPQAFALIAFGGAGPLHAVSLARALGIKRVVVPPHAGVLSAVGMLAAKVRHDFVQTNIIPADDLTPRQFAEIFGELEARATGVMEDEGFRPTDVMLERWVEMQYIGQAYQLPVKLDERSALADPAEALRSLFNSEHERRYGFAFDGAPAETVQYGVTASAEIHPLAMNGDSDSADGMQLALIGEREITLDGRAEIAKVFERTGTAAWTQVRGPAVIESTDTTVVLPAGSSGQIDAHGVLLIDLA
jgi:N-methylhydantoinase A